VNAAETAPEPAAERPAPLGAVLAVTFLGSVSGGAFLTGIFFVTAEHYGFSRVRNLVLAVSLGAVYVAAARFIGPLLRALAGRVGPRGTLAITLGGWGLVALAPLAARDSAAVLWGAALLGSIGSAGTWPVVESYLGAGRHGAEMRAALGWFNLAWTAATAAPLLLMPLLARADVLWTIAISAVVNGGALLALPFLPARPAAHGRAAAAAAIGPEYPFLLRSAAWLLPLSYLMSSTLAPVLPHRLAAVTAGAGAGVAPSVVAAVWMVARFLTLFLMWRIGFWHGRWGTLAAAIAALAGGLATVLLAPSLAAVVVGLVLFGTGMGLTYYTALYYSLAVGHAAVDAGGNFEALIGAGYCVGPVLGLLGQAAAGAGLAGTAGSATVAGTWLAAAGVGLLALGPYRAARRGRAHARAGRG
jgi:hypothetical protein